MPISDVEYLVRSSQSKEILVQFPETDFRLSMDNSEDFFNLLKLRYVTLSPANSMKVYEVPFKHLSQYRTQRTTSGQRFDNHPEEKFCIEAESVYGSKTEEAKTLYKKKPSNPKTIENDRNARELDDSKEQIIGEAVKQPGGDDQLGMEFDPSNNGYLNDIGIDDEHQFIGHNKRRLTIEEESELRST